MNMAKWEYTDNKYVHVFLCSSLSCFITTPCQKFARTGNIMHNGIFRDKANVKEFGYVSDSTSLSPIRLLTQSSSLHLMPVTGLEDFSQLYVFCSIKH